MNNEYSGSWGWLSLGTVLLNQGLLNLWFLISGSPRLLRRSLFLSTLSVSVEETLCQALEYLSAFLNQLDQLSGPPGCIQEPSDLGSAVLMKDPCSSRVPTPVAEPTLYRTWQLQALRAVLCCPSLGMTTPECFQPSYDSLAFTKKWQTTDCECNTWRGQISCKWMEMHYW